MIVATGDTRTPTDIALAAYERAGEPKKLIAHEGGHFGAYVAPFDETGGRATDWFIQHLKPAATS
ncbi:MULTISPECIES: hypothetical protein [unclassified Streptomyces]|uniref:hypothetical protein n=1 Tax=unclassified Streptomyces TaxID=2593676 RepID=UPI003D9482E1